jgi:hypothetical protein
MQPFTKSKAAIEELLLKPVETVFLVWSYILSVKHFTRD